MDLQKFIRVVQSGAVLLIFLGAAIGFGTEIFLMFKNFEIKLKISIWNDPKIKSLLA